MGCGNQLFRFGSFSTEVAAGSQPAPCGCTKADPGRAAARRPPPEEPRTAPCRPRLQTGAVPGAHRLRRPPQESAAGWERDRAESRPAPLKGCPSSRPCPCLRLGARRDLDAARGSAAWLPAGLS